MCILVENNDVSLTCFYQQDGESILPDVAANVKDVNIKIEIADNTEELRESVLNTLVHFLTSITSARAYHC